MDIAVKKNKTAITAIDDLIRAHPAFTEIIRTTVNIAESTQKAANNAKPG